jgi:hypothetical protein
MYEHLREKAKRDFLAKKQVPKKKATTHYSPTKERAAYRNNEIWTRNLGLAFRKRRMIGVRVGIRNQRGSICSSRV